MVSIDLILTPRQTSFAYCAQAGYAERSGTHACDRQRLAETHDTDDERVDSSDTGPYVYAVPGGSIFIEIDGSAKLATVTMTVMAVGVHA